MKRETIAGRAKPLVSRSQSPARISLKTKRTRMIPFLTWKRSITNAKIYIIDCACKDIDVCMKD